MQTTGEGPCGRLQASFQLNFSSMLSGCFMGDFSISMIHAKEYISMDWHYYIDLAHSA